MLDENIQEWMSKYNFTAWMWVGRNPHPFGNERHTISCGLSTIMWFAEILEGRDRPPERGRPELGEIGKTVGTILRRTRPIWNCANLVIMGSGFCVTKDLVEL